MDPPLSLHVLTVACGTYDGSVFALNYNHDKSAVAGPSILKPIFVDPSAHNGAVTTVAVADNVVASGSGDEIIQLFSLPLRSRLGSLELHTGTIRQLEFANDSLDSNLSHLFSISDDSSIAIWRRDSGSDGSKSAIPNNWECIRVMRRHKGPVRSLAVHPSNRCAFSISDDKTLRVWNLIRGRQAYATRLKLLAEGAQAVRCSPSGRRLLFIWPSRFDVIDLDQSSREGESDKRPLGIRLGSVQFEQPMTASPVFFSEDDHLNDPASEDGTAQSLHVLAGIGPYVSAFRCPLPKTFKAKSGHAETLGQIKLPGKRVKELRVLPCPQDIPSYTHEHRLLVAATTSASGSHIRGYAVNLNAFKGIESSDSLTPLFVYDLSGARVTSMSASWMKAELMDDTED